MILLLVVLSNNKIAFLRQMGSVSVAPLRLSELWPCRESTYRLSKTTKPSKVPRILPNMDSEISLLPCLNASLDLVSSLLPPSASQKQRNLDILNLNQIKMMKNTANIDAPSYSK